MIRVLVAEDSSTTRQLLVALLSADSEIEVLGEATNGADAVEKARELRPDVITMDIQMPVMDGFEATRRIMTEAPTPIVIVSSSFNARDVEVCMHALRMGALSVLAKPSGIGSRDFDESADNLVKTVKAMSQVRVVRRWPEREPPVLAAVPPSVTADVRPRIAAAAASTGGPAALHQLLTGLPGDFPLPLLVVQHISIGFVEGLARWLNDASLLRVKIAEEGEVLAPATVYLSPDHHHLGVRARETISLSDAPPIDGFRPSASYLFESVSRVYGAAAVALVMTGMGTDGVRGLCAFKAAGGKVMAQDESTSVVFGMPGAAVSAGCVDWVLPINMMSLRLASLAGPGQKGDSNDSSAHR